MAREYDPVLVEVIRNELAAVSEEMAIATVRTARGPMAKAGDLTTAITDVLSAWAKAWACSCSSRWPADW